jgi:hypothetical protein
MGFINQKVVWLIFSFLVFLLQADAQEKIFDESVLSQKGKEAYQMLLEVDTFALFGVGYGGETSEGELALDTLAKEKEAISAFRSLVTKASPEGGIYALIGLKMLECDCFNQELANYKRLPEPVAREINQNEKIGKGYLRTQSGCIIRQEKRSKTIQEVKAGRTIQMKISNYKARKQNAQK